MNIRKQDKRTGRNVSGVHEMGEGGRALCSVDVMNIGNPREHWVEVPDPVTCAGCRRVEMARELKDYVSRSSQRTIKRDILLRFAEFFEANEVKHG